MNMKLFKKIFTRMMAGVLVILSVLGGVAFAKFYVVPPVGDPDILDEVVHGRINILCMATDASGLRTDTMILVSLDSDRKYVNLLSIPRDTRVNMGKGYGYQKINAAYAFGEDKKRQENSIKYVKELTGLPIHHYAVIGPKGFRDLIDALGGVWFNVPQRMHYSDPVQNLYIDLYPGEQLLDGDKAEQFTRFRSYLEGDLDRVRAQQKFISSLFEQKLKPEYILKTPEIFSKMSDSISTSIRVSDFPVFIKFMNLINKESIRTFELPGTDGMISGVSYFLCDVEATEKLIETEFLGKTPEPSPSETPSSN